MQRIRLEELKPGMVVAKPIYDQEGRVLLNRGVVLRDSSSTGSGRSAVLQSILAFPG